MEEQGNELLNTSETKITIDANMVSPFGVPDDGVKLDDGYTVGTKIEDPETTNKDWEKASLPTEIGFWGKFKAFWLQEIKVELTPKQQKVEDEINAFLFQEIHFFGKKK